MADEPVEVEEVDEEEEPRLDPELAARRAAGMTFIRRYGDPEIEWASKSDEEIAEEGCLSIPGVGVDVERPVHVRVRAQDEYGESRMVEASGLEARVIQHEMDHLDGVLILDRTSRDQRKEAIRTLREQERAERESQAA